MAVFIGIATTYSRNWPAGGKVLLWPRSVIMLRQVEVRKGG